MLSCSLQLTSNHRAMACLVLFAVISSILLTGCTGIRIIQQEFVDGKWTDVPGTERKVAASGGKVSTVILGFEDTDFCIVSADFGPAATMDTVMQVFRETIQIVSGGLGN